MAIVRHGDRRQLFSLLHVDRDAGTIRPRTGERGGPQRGGSGPVRCARSLGSPVGNGPSRGVDDDDRV